MKVLNKLILAASTTVIALALVPRAISASAPASIAGKAIVLEIQNGVEPFSPGSGFAILPNASGTGFTIAGIPSQPNASGSYTYSTDGGATATMSVNLGGLGQYRLTLSFSSDRGGTFALAATDGTGTWANGQFLYLSQPVPTSLVGAELDLTPDPITFTGTGKLVMGTSGTSCTLYGNGGVIEGQGSYAYSRPSPCLGKLVLHDSTRGDATAYFGFYPDNTGAFGIEGMSASEIVSCVLVVVDHLAPTVTISTPAAGARVLQLPVQVQGTATDNSQVVAVTYTVQNANGISPVQTATGTTSWTATIPNPVPGTNIITVTAIDAGGNSSAPVSRAFFYVASSVLTVQSEGVGSFRPNLNGQSLEIGKSYSITATPGAGYLFGVWSDGQTSVGTPTLTFTMSANLVLQATFVTNQFPAALGSYSGMFPSYNQGLFPASARPPEALSRSAMASANAESARNVGSLTVTVTTKGGYTGKLQTGGGTYSFSGQFDGYGFAKKSVARKNAAPLLLNLQIGFNGEDMVVGNVGDGQTWTNTLSASRLVYSSKHPAPLAGKNYTFTIPTALETGSATGPTGYSYGTVKIQPSGLVAVQGKLADGTAITQSATLSKDGYWPLCISLYKGAGLLAGWVDCDADGVNGDVLWNAPGAPATRYCGSGFAHRASLVSSPYLPTAASVLSITNAEVQFAGGNLSAAFTNSIRIDAKSKVINLGSNKLTLTLTKASGLFKGSVTPPGSTRAVPFQGVVLQNINSGAGYFLGTNTMGSVLLSPVP